MGKENHPSKLESGIERLNQDPYLLAFITAIPVVGGSITQVLTGIGQQIVQERNKRLFEQVSEHLATVDEEALRRNYFVDPEKWVDVGINGASAVVRSRGVARFPCFWGGFLAKSEDGATTQPGL